MSSLLLDTNVLLFDANALFSFPDRDIVIPLAVIREIDSFKHDQSETGRNARNVIAAIDRLRERGPLRFGVKLDNGSTLTIVPDPLDNHDRHPVASQLLALARQLTADAAPDDITIISKNISLRLQADAAGFPASDFDPPVTRSVDAMRGWHLLNASAPQLAALREGRPLPASPNINWHPNEYAFIRDRDNTSDGLCARFSADDRQLWPLLRPVPELCGIRALNLEQTFALDALLDDSVKLVTLAGKAGTGKTLLAIAAGLHQVFADPKFQKLLIFRPTLPVSRDLGYLPGDLGEKMKPWMQPVFDALDFIRLQDRKSPSRSLPNDLLTCPEITVEPLTYIRGRSIPGQFIIIDEAQNLTPLEVKTAITRCGNGSKIILTGDPDQIDNPYVDTYSNGLTRLVDKFLPSELSAHITLQKGERSLLAETASRLL